MPENILNSIPKPLRVFPRDFATKEDEIKLELNEENKKTKLAVKNLEKRSSLVSTTPTPSRTCSTATTWLPKATAFRMASSRLLRRLFYIFYVKNLITIKRKMCQYNKKNMKIFNNNWNDKNSHCEGDQVDVCGSMSQCSVS